LLNVIAFTWFTGYLFTFRDQLKIPAFGYTKTGSFILLLLFGLLIYVVSLGITDVFAGLVTNSDINFDVTNILNLNVYSWIGIVALCLSIMSLLLLIDLLVTLAHKLVPDTKRLLFTGVFFFGCAPLIRSVFFVDFSLDNLPLPIVLVFVLIGVRGWYLKKWKGRFDLAIFISTLLLLAARTAIKHAQFQRSKREEAQQQAIFRMEAIDDANALALFRDLEKEIVKDPVLIEYFERPQQGDRDLLNEHLRSEERR